MAIPGMVLLTFMSVHLFQIRLGDTQTDSIWATFARQVASRSRVRHSALPVALRRHGLASKNPAALRHARLTQSGHDLHMSFNTVPTGFEQVGEIPHLAARDGRTGRFYRPAASFWFFAETRVRHHSVASLVSCQNYEGAREGGVRSGCFVGQLADHQPGTTPIRVT